MRTTNEPSKIMYGEKATQVTVTLPDGSQHQQWFCIKCRRIHGLNDSGKHSASWCCCTRMICACGKEHEKHWTMCDTCRAKKSTEHWFAKPEIDWNGKWPIALHDSDKYFFTDSDLLEYIHWNCEDKDVDTLVSSLRLTTCRPNKPREFDVNDWCADDLGDDSDGVPDAESIDKRINAILGEVGILSFSSESARLNVRQVLDAIGYEQEND